jgi:hypothetical protein
MTVAITYQSDTYICCSFRFSTVPKTFTANITQSTTMATSSGHSSSAYSSDWVFPMASETAAARIPTLNSQSWTRASFGKRSGLLQSRITIQKERPKIAPTPSPKARPFVWTARRRP